MLSKVSTSVVKSTGKKSLFSTLNLSSIGVNRFDDHAMKDAVSADTYNNFHAALNSGESMDKKCANELAEKMMAWAMERGASNYAHWFSAVRGANGLKNDAFIDYDFGGEGQYGGVIKDVVHDFSGSKLFFNETDGSSFPNGGLRQTHRAAAFMNWDRQSAPFVRGGTLFIPATFVTHNGDALDDKTPLLRSQECVDREGLRLLKNLGYDKPTKVVANVGWEQEFFMVDREAYLARPDLMACNRTVIGAQPPRGQQTDYNYFNKTDPRVRAYLDDVQKEMLDAGSAMSVFHNEVAPSQYELSPIFKLTNVAADENTMCMEILEEVAARHGLVCLMHEKPFAGVNGSGKHNNWGLNTDVGDNLFVPGKTDEAQARFTAMVAVLAKTLNTHGDIIRTGVACSGNDHRLGAQEAPPAIISLYTGDGMEAHIRKVMDGGELHGYGMDTTTIEVGSNNVSPITANMEDRNRTAPFPFCGNRFEFRAVGSTQNIAFPMAIVNTAYAESMAALSDRIEGGESVRDAVANTYAENINVIFNGDGYSDEWPIEAEKRGLKNLKNTYEAAATMASDKNKALFSSMNVFTNEELEARQEIMAERFTADIGIEADTMLQMIQTGVLPACAQDLKNFEGTGLGATRQSVYAELDKEVGNFTNVLHNFPEDGSPLEQAKYSQYEIRDAMEQLRAKCDAAEVVCEDDLWPYPKYKDMLFGHHSESPKFEGY